MKQIFIYTLILSSFLLGSCGNNEDENGPSINIPQTIIELSATELTYTVDGGEQVLNVHSNTNWVVYSNTPWCHIDTEKGYKDATIKITVLPHYQPNIRNAEVTVKDEYGFNYKTVVIKQEKKDITIITSTEELKTLKNTGTKHITNSLMFKGDDIVTLNSLGNQLEQIDGDLILHCNNLTTLDGLYGLKHIGGNLIIARGGFTSFEGLNNLITIGGNFDILPFEEFEELYKPINGQLFGGSYIELKSFKGLERLKSIGGSLNMECRFRAYSVFTDFSSFEGLNNLESIGKDFTFIVEAASAFTNGSLYDLTTFKGLNKLKSIGGSFIIKGESGQPQTNALTRLKSFDGLNSLETIGGDFKIISEASANNSSYTLTALEFKGLTTLKSIGGDFKIISQSRDDVGNPPSTAYSLASIKSFNDLDNLNKISGDLTIKSCGNLVNIDGLINIAILGGCITIENCKSLNDFCILKSLLGDSEKTIYTNGNGYNPTKYQILNGECSKQPE